MSELQCYEYRTGKESIIQSSMPCPFKKTMAFEVMPKHCLIFKYVFERYFIIAKKRYAVSFIGIGIAAFMFRSQFYEVII